jgi:signal transduction histidine kinase
MFVLETIDLLSITRELVAAGPLGDRPQFRIESGATLIRVVANRAQLNRALANLLDNAAKYTPPDREIVIRVAAEEIDGRTWAVASWICGDDIGVVLFLDE